MRKATKTQLRAFCKTYLAQALQRDTDVSGVDDWVQWGGYDLNFSGAYYDIRLPEDNTTALYVDVYPDDWRDALPAPLFGFAVPQFH